MMTDKRIENKDSNVIKCNTNTNSAEYPLIKNNLIVLIGYLRMDIGSPTRIPLLLNLSDGLLVVVLPEACCCCCCSCLSICLLLCRAIVSTILAPTKALLVEVEVEEEPTTSTSTDGPPLPSPSSAVSSNGVFISCLHTLVAWLIKANLPNSFILVLFVLVLLYTPFHLSCRFGSTVVLFAFDHAA